MDFKDLEGRAVKISAHTITAKDERGKICGMVRDVRNFSDVPPRVKFDFNKIIRDSGLWGNVDMSRVFVDDKRLVWLYPAHKDEFYNKYVKGNESLFEADAAYYEKRREIEEKAKSAGVLVVHCFY